MRLVVELSGESSAAIHEWLDQLDDQQSVARDELVRLSVERVRFLVRQLMLGFSRLRRWEDSDDVLQATLVKLHKSLATLRPQSVAEYYGLAMLHIRRELIDLARHHFGPQGQAAKHLSPPDGEVASSWLVENAHGRESLTPNDWAEFHEQVALLPHKLRETFELIFYHGLTRQAAADVLQVSEKTVRRRWYLAREWLGRQLCQADSSSAAGDVGDPSVDHDIDDCEPQQPETT
jgi:RNA polymerase sigma factor (sigma-70 family)